MDYSCVKTLEWERSIIWYSYRRKVGYRKVHGWRDLVVKAGGVGHPDEDCGLGPGAGGKDLQAVAVVGQGQVEATVLVLKPISPRSK